MLAWPGGPSAWLRNVNGHLRQVRGQASQVWWQSGCGRQLSPAQDCPPKQQSLRQGLNPMLPVDSGCQGSREEEREVRRNNGPGVVPPEALLQRAAVSHRWPRSRTPASHSGRLCPSERALEAGKETPSSVSQLPLGSLKTCLQIL